VSIYRHISAERAHCDLPVSLMCELLGVSESGFWAWLGRAPSDRALSDAWLTERIRTIHAASSGRYGSPRVHAMLRREGIRVGEKRIARLMRAAGLEGAHRRRRRKGCTVPVAGVEPFRDLVGRDFRPDAPNTVWAAEIKQIKTGEGWLYLAAAQDLFSRRIVGWAMQAHMRSELVVAALEMAVGRRRPATGTIHHSDSEGLGDRLHVALHRRSTAAADRECPFRVMGAACRSSSGPGLAIARDERELRAVEALEHRVSGRSGAGGRNAVGGGCPARWSIVYAQPRAASVSTMQRDPSQE